MNLTIPRQAMFSARDQAQSKTYRLYQGKSGKKWLVANQINAADNIYVEGEVNSDGFGGSILSFTLTDGTVLKLKGPWHSNSHALYCATGVDIRNQHMTWGVISLGREYNEHYQPIMIDVLYQDDEPIIGSFDRIRELAQNYANDLNKTVYYYSQSQGGSSCGPIEPK